MARRAAVIPVDLLDQVERGNVLLFLGERLTRDASGAAALDGLAATLAARADIPDAAELSFPELAQAYEDERGRHALIDLLRGHFQAIGDSPQPAHRLVAGLASCTVLATTDLSGCLEQAFRAAGRPLQVVVRNEDVPFAEAGAAQLFRLRGALDRPDTLLLTEDDLARFARAQDSVSILLQGQLSSKTILFLGYDLDDPHFRQLYEKIAGDLDRFQRRAYAFGSEPPPQVARWCKRKGIDLLALDTADFLKALADALAARARPAIPAPPSLAPDQPLPAQPYKLLDYYEAEDAGIYFGREQEILELSSLIRAHRLTLLYGASGVGKTSLLLAGVLPRLAAHDPPYTAIYVRALEDPALVIRRATARRLPGAALPAEAPLLDFLSAATGMLAGPLLIVLDQFEEFFIRLSPQFRAAFTAELGAICDARDLPIKVVLSLREDWLAAVNELERRIPEVFRNRMRVLPLSPAQAHQAITAPLERLGLQYEPALVEQLLSDLAGGAGDSILPPQLQVVCSALYKRMPPGEQTIRLADYTQIGGARGVLQQYLEDELGRLGRDERAMAKGILAELVTSQGTKAVRAAADLALALDTPAATLAPVIELLLRARLLRAIEREDGELAYELAHEYLIREIDLAAEAQTRKQAEELVRQEVENWHRFGTLLGADKLALVNEVRGLLRLGPEAQELLLRSAIEVGDEVDYWLGRVEEPDRRAAVLAARAASRVAAVRRRAAQALAGQDRPESLDPLLELALRDPDETVREAARASLARLSAQRPAVIARLEEVVKSGDRAGRAAALASLSKLPLPELPPRLRGPVLRARAQETATRLARASVATAGRRAAVISVGGALAIILAVMLLSLNAYYIDVGPALIPGEFDNQIVVRRGLPFLPAFSAVEVDTGITFSALSPDAQNAVTSRQIWGFWVLRGKRDYDQWGKDLAVKLKLDDGLPMLWYLSRAEGEKWLDETVRSDIPGSRAWAAETYIDLYLVFQNEFPAILFELLQEEESNAQARIVDAIGRAIANPHIPITRLATALLPLLTDAEGPVRATTVEVLGQAAANPQLNPTELVAGLLPLLQDNNPDVRASAGEAIGQIAADPRLDPTDLDAKLLPLLQDNNPGVRASAVFALGQIAANPRLNPTAMVPSLLPLLTVAEWPVSTNAVTALVQAATNPQLDPTELVAGLLPLLQDNDLAVRPQVAEILGQVAASPQLNPGELVAGLLPLLQDSDSTMRAKGVAALGQVAAHPQLDPTDLIPSLLPLLTDADWAVRSQALDALGQVAAHPQVELTELVESLLRLLQDSDPDTRVNAAFVLGQVATNPQINLDELVVGVLPLLQANDPGVRVSARDALAQIAASPQFNPTALLARVLPLLQANDPDVRFSAVYALWQAAAANPQLDPTELVAPMLPLLQDGDPDVRSSAAFALGQVAAANPQLDPTRLAAGLLPLLQDNNLDVRSSAVYALGQVAAANPQLDSTRLVAGLQQLLQDGDPGVRSSAASALGQIAANIQDIPPDVVAGLQQLLQADDPGVRSNAAYVLGQIAANVQEISPDVIAGLQQLLQDDDPGVYFAAVTVLGQIAANPQFNPTDLIVSGLPLLQTSDVDMSYAMVLILRQAATNPQVALTDLVAGVLPLLQASDEQTRDIADAILEAALINECGRGIEINSMGSARMLIDPTSALTRPLAARALFLCALEDPARAQAIRATLESAEYAGSPRPIARLWSNKTLVMLEIADRLHAAGPLSEEKAAELRAWLAALQLTTFFGGEFVSASWSARSWLDEQVAAQQQAVP